MLRAVVASGLLLLLLGPAAAEPARQAPVSSDYSAQSRRPPPPRLRVYPGGRRLLYRDCDFRLVPQWRPSGPVIVPWQRCWWVRG
jgi:hypothetical protein